MTAIEDVRLTMVLRLAEDMALAMEQENYLSSDMEKALDEYRQVCPRLIPFGPDLVPSGPSDKPQNSQVTEN